MRELVEAETLATPVRRVAWSSTPSAWPTGRIIAGLMEADAISARIRRHEAGFRKPGRRNSPRWPRIVTFGIDRNPREGRRSVHARRLRRDLTLADLPVGRPAYDYRRPLESLGAVNAALSRSMATRTICPRRRSSVKRKESPGESPVSRVGLTAVKARVLSAITPGIARHQRRRDAMVSAIANTPAAASRPPMTTRSHPSGSWATVSHDNRKGNGQVIGSCRAGAVKPRT